MIRLLLAFVRPLRSISQELRAIRELLEQWMLHQDPPVYRITEKPSRRDTEVTYMGVEPERKRPFKSWFNE